MKDKKIHTTGNDSGKSFQSTQRAIDTGLNEKIKSENDSRSDDASQIKRNDKRDRTSEVSQKKTGGRKQKSTGD